jgi:hypothetical protein
LNAKQHNRKSLQGIILKINVLNITIRMIQGASRGLENSFSIAVEKR